MRLRYTGVQPTSFMTHDVGSVEPGGEFVVPDEASMAFLTRPDVELVVPPASTSTSTRGRKQAKTPVEPVVSQPTDDTVLTTEEVCGVPDDH